MNAHHHPRQLALLALTLSGLLARGADVMDIALFKRQVFFQSDSGAPVVYEDAPFGAGAAVDLTASNAVTFATVTLPSSVVENLGLRFERYYLPPHWECIETHPFTTKPALDSAWGDGQYQFTIETVHDGRRSVSLSLTGDTYPNVPHIQNFTNAQFVDASKDFVLKWDAFAGGTANDIVYVLILDRETMTTAFCTASPSDPSHLNGTATQVVIPAGSLVADKSYLCELWFDKVSSRNTTDYPGVLAGAAYVSETGFFLNTTSTNLPPTITEEPHNISTWVGNYDDSVGFSVTATGVGTLSYQWRTNGTPIASRNIIVAGPLRCPNGKCGQLRCDRGQRLRLGDKPRGHSHRHQRLASNLSAAAGSKRHDRQQCDFCRVHRHRHTAVRLPVAVQRDEHPRRKVVQLHDHQRPAG